MNCRETLSLLIIVLLSLSLLPALAQYTPVPEQENIVHVIPSNYFSSGSASVWIDEYGRVVVFNIGDAGGFAGVTVRIPLGLGGFNGTLSSIYDFGFKFRYDVKVPSVYLVIDVTTPNGTQYLLRGNATTLPLQWQLLTAVSSSVEWCVGTWDGVNPESLELVECGLSFWDALATLPPDSAVNSLGLYYSSESAQAKIYSWVYFNGEYYYLTIGSAYDHAGDGYTILIHSGEYNYWDLMPSYYWDSIPFYMKEIVTLGTSYYRNVVIKGEDRNLTKLVNPRISIYYYIENLELSSLTVFINKPQAWISLSEINGLAIVNSTFIVNVSSKSVTEWEYYEPLQVNANGVYIANSAFNVIIDNVKLEGGDIDAVLLYVRTSNDISIVNVSTHMYIGDIELLGTYSGIFIRGIRAEDSNGIWHAHSLLTLWAGGDFSGSGHMSLRITMVQLHGVAGVHILGNNFTATITPTISSVDVFYSYTCIEIHEGIDLYVEGNAINLVHGVPRGGVEGILLEEVNNTVVYGNVIEGNVLHEEGFIDSYGVVIASMYRYRYGEPKLSRDIQVIGNRISGLDVGILIDAEVEVNETIKYNMVDNVAILFNEIVGNVFGIWISGYNGSAYPGEAHYNSIYGNSEAGLLYTGRRAGLILPLYNASYNWWGDISGPYAPGLNDGVGDAIRRLGEVIFEPWLSAPPPEGAAVWGGTSLVYVSAGEVFSVEAIDEADMEVLIEAGSNVGVTLSLLKYGENPAPETPPFNDVKYVDVKLVADDTSALTEIEVRIYYRADEVVNELNLGPFWWNGSSWVLCSVWGINTTDVDGYGGYVWIKIRHDTSPSIEDLLGTPIALVEGPYPIPEAPLTALAVSIAALASIVYIIWRRTRSRSLS